jgi:two-component system, NarL family, invasion response regulator UvrY
MGTKGTDKPLHELLSEREFQVLRMIASGKSVKEIAEELSLSVKTVSTYRTRILEKTGMKTTVELIRCAFRARLVD